MIYNMNVQYNSDRCATSVISSAFCIDWKCKQQHAGGFNENKDSMVTPRELPMLDHRCRAKTFGTSRRLLQEARY